MPRFFHGTRGAPSRLTGFPEPANFNSEYAALTLREQAQQVYASVLLIGYGIFLCSYFIFEDWSEPVLPSVGRSASL